MARLAGNAARISGVRMKKYHYYSFSFSFNDTSGNGTAWVACSTKGKNVTISDIRKAKEMGGVHADSIPISISYMGYMTREEAMS